MIESQLVGLLALLVVFTLTSAFFSSSETGIMSINRYRLRHQAKTSKSAKRVQNLLSRPDRLLGVILLGNTFVNIAASSVGTLIAVSLLGDEYGAIAATVIMTLVLLIFGEVSPKTLAALYPEKVAYPTSFILQALLWVLYPLVWSINAISNGLLRMCGVKVKISEHHPGFSQEELRTLVLEASSLIPSKNRQMLLSILDLENIAVDGIMIPRNEVVGLDLDNEWSAIVSQLSNTQHTFLPVYRGDLNHIVGILHAKKALHLLVDPEFDESMLRSVLDDPFYVPEGTSLTQQLFNFQKNKERFALVVDEYGDILGLITLEDILEEIVGEFTTNVSSAYAAILPQPDGSYLVEGSTTIREFNQVSNWDLPTDGPKTINGLLIDYLETIPDAGTCCLIDTIPMEVVKVQDNRIKAVKIFPRREPLEKPEHDDTDPE